MSKREELELALLDQIKAAKLPTPQREAMLIPGRRFRWDLFWPGSQIAAEINGGTWIKGGHSTGKGIERDYEKSNLATLAGFHCFSFSASMVKDGTALAIIKQALETFQPF